MKYIILGIVVIGISILSYIKFMEISKTPEDKYMDCYNNCAKIRGELPPMTEDICLQKCVPIYMEEKLNGK